MLTSQQVRNLQELHDLLPQEDQVGPIDPPRIGVRHHCFQGRPCWFYDVTTVQFAERLAVTRNPDSRRRTHILGLPVGPRLAPLVEHYGLDQQQVQYINDIDLQPIPGTYHKGRQVWLERQQACIREIIRCGTPAAPAPRAYVNNYEPATILQVTTEPVLDNTTAGNVPALVQTSA